MMANEEEAESRRNEESSEKERVYKTKLIQFLGRTTPIILQNDNGPCPLLAICNVLLLKNSLNLNEDSSGEVSLQRLLTLVADRLIESNSSSENKDAGYLENQRQNISDALNLLDRLATGIDVNVQFRKIDDFEFTRECAIFDLLDIPLYHGWIVDPQDAQTAIAIGSKSYNTLMGELVALETKNSDEVHKSSSEGDCVDFAAATTATLGVPSPSLSRARSFDDSPRSVSSLEGARKGDKEEEAEVLRALKLSDTELQTSFDEYPLGEKNRSDIPAFANESTTFEAGVGGDMLDGHSGGHLQFNPPEQSTVDNNASGDCDSGRQSSEINPIGKHQEHFKISTECSISSDLKECVKSADLVLNESLSNSENTFTACKDHEDGPIQDQKFQEMRAQASTSSIHLEQEIDQCGCEKTAFSGTSATDADSDLSGVMREHMDIHKSDTSSLDGSEPIYEGEERILHSALSSYENREPMYEGEVILAEQAEKGTDESHPNNDITHHNGEVIRNFFNNNASQLTIYGLFCLLEGLKERELCVFFRNNHFSTMFKFKGELYLLATDQGFINQPDLVWEKLNEVNGDTVFMTGNFTEFKVNNHTNDNWDQQNAMASTADYLASIDNSIPSNSSFNSDLQLAIALQQQEFDNQPQQRQNSQQHQNSQPHQNSQQQSSGGTSRLIIGPQDRRSSASNSSAKQESKSKDKCTVM